MKERCIGLFILLFVLPTEAADCGIDERSKLTAIDDARAAIRCMALEIRSLKESMRQVASVPAGAVVAFRSAACPAVGWRPYRLASGRTIVGVGTADGRSFLLEETAGKVEVKLEKENLPPHQHDTALALGDANVGFGLGSQKRAVYGSKLDPLSTALTSSVGEGLPVPTLPPFVALRYCEKCETDDCTQTSK